MLFITLVDVYGNRLALKIEDITSIIELETNDSSSPYLTVTLKDGRHFDVSDGYDTVMQTINSISWVTPAVVSS
jgi:hypothetical protein